MQTGPRIRPLVPSRPGVGVMCAVSLCHLVREGVRRLVHPEVTSRAILKITLGWVVIGGGLPCMSGCRRGVGEPETARSATELTIKGSDTMVHLVSLWAERYMQRHDETVISVTGGGSGTGFASLLNGTTDICAASRAMRDQERQLARKRGITPFSYVVARDGIAVIAHPSNRVDSLSIEQVRKIYTGVYDQWSQVGGANQNIVVFSRDTSSGTYLFFQEHVLRRQAFRPDARLMPATSAIVQAVAEDEGATGYVGLGYASGASERIKSLAIRELEGEEAVEPSIESVRSGRYSIARPFRFYTSGEPTGLAASFLEFCLGPEGQSIVHETGYAVVE